MFSFMHYHNDIAVRTLLVKFGPHYSSSSIIPACATATPEEIQHIIHTHDMITQALSNSITPVMHPVGAIVYAFKNDLGMLHRVRHHITKQARKAAGSYRTTNARMIVSMQLCKQAGKNKRTQKR